MQVMQRICPVNGWHAEKSLLPFSSVLGRVLYLVEE